MGLSRARRSPCCRFLVLGPLLVLLGLRDWGEIVVFPVQLLRRGVGFLLRLLCAVAPFGLLLLVRLPPGDEVVVLPVQGLTRANQCRGSTGYRPARQRGSLTCAEARDSRARRQPKARFGVGAVTRMANSGRGPTRCRVRIGPFPNPNNVYCPWSSTLVIKRKLIRIQLSDCLHIHITED